MKYWLLVLTGCLEVPTGPAVQCSSDADCNTGAGEVCEEGTCWGNPPPGPFAAALGSPNDRTDLIGVELPSLAIPADGQLGELALDAPVTLSGRVEAYCANTSSCSGDSLGATITISRPSLFPGGPGFSAVVTSTEGIARGSESFSVQVPATRGGDPPYTIVVVPDGRGDLPPANGGQSAAMIAPPLRETGIVLADNTHVTLVLGSATGSTISGSLSDGAGHTLSKYRVAALGHWEASAQTQEVSTVAYSTDGGFTLTIADGVVGPVQIVARPYDPAVVAPTLQVALTTSASTTKVLAQPSLLGTRVSVPIKIEGVTTGGEVAPVSGAHVIVTGQYTPPFNDGTFALLTAEATTGDDGIVTLDLLDGDALATTYKLRVIPPAGSPLGIKFDDAFSLSNTTPIRLPPRVVLRGRVVDQAGNPISGISVIARPSLRFRWSLDTDPQQFLKKIPDATTVTPGDGTFAVYVDGLLGDIYSGYDLELDAPAGSPVPSWFQTDIQMPRPVPTTIVLPDTVFPDAAFIHGTIVDPDDLMVQGGELRIFKVTTDNSLCDMVLHEPADCQIPAQVLGHGTSDDVGIVRLTLPRP